MRTLAQTILALGTGRHEIEVDDIPLTVYYDEIQALGDDNLPVKGDKTGEFEVFERTGDLTITSEREICREHVSPHGASGYGNDAALLDGAERCARAIMRLVTSRRIARDLPQREAG